MSIFSTADGREFSASELDEISIMVKIRDSNRIDELPSNYTVISGDMLDFNESSAHGSIGDNGYFQGGSISTGGEAVAILSDDGRIFISFAGTNDSFDLFSILSFGDDSYLDGFVEYLESVAQFALENGYTIDLVTGKSLGGAVTNMLRDNPDIADGAFADATYFAVASPLIAENTDNILNFGYDNDFAFEAYETYFGTGEGDYASSTDNIIFYNDEYASSNWRQFFNFSAHSYNDFTQGIEALTTTVFADELTQDSFVIIGDTDVIDMNTALTRTGYDGDTAYFIGSGSTEETVQGTTLNDHIDLGAGNDIVYSGAGDDVIHGGSQADLIYAGAGNDIVSGDNGIDVVYLEDGDDIFHDNNQGSKWGVDEVHGGNGDDTINGGAGDDKFYGDSGDDLIYGGSGKDTINGGTGNDVIHGGSQADLIYAGAGNDIVSGDNGIDVVYLEDGDDIFHDNNQGSKWGVDEVHGGNGDDTINGGAGDDKFYGDSGDDLIYGGAGNDTIYGGTGNDIVNGGSGNDTFVFADNDGSDSVSDFNLDQDTLDIGGGFDGFTNEEMQDHMYMSGSTTIIDLGNNNTISLSNISQNDWDDIQFV